MQRSWDVQTDKNWWISLGFHIDHTDPSITLHLPGLIVSFGRLIQPGFRYSLTRWIASRSRRWIEPEAPR